MINILRHILFFDLQWINLLKMNVQFRLYVENAERLICYNAMYLYCIYSSKFVDLLNFRGEIVR